MLKNLLAISICLFAVACQSTATAPEKKGAAVMPVGALASEYGKDKAAMVAKYQGKPLTVKGYATIAPMMPRDATDEGLLGITEKGGDLLYVLNCKFKPEHKAEFASVTDGVTVTVNGVYSDEIGTDLKSCRLIEVEK